MSNIRKLPTTEESVVEEAAAWITKLDKGLSSADEHALAVWLSASRANYREFMESAKLWDRMDGLTRLAELFPEPELPAPALKREAWRGWRVAALLVLSVGASWIAWDSMKEPQPIQEPAMVATDEVPGRYETEIGEQSVLNLSDGTRIVLNTNSLLVVGYTKNNRLLRLERGEIHVNVAHDPDRPLSVMVGEKVVQAVGTEFNLEITSDQNVELVVTDGVVMIGVLEAPISQLPPDKPVLLQPSSTLVAAGQEIEIDTIDVSATALEKKEIKAEEIAVRLSWRNGNLIFRGESLEDAVTEVGRYTAVEFVFLDDNAKQKRLSGMFKAGDVDGLLVALRKNFNISYEWVGVSKIMLSANE